MYTGFVDLELQKVRKILNRWETLSVDDLIYTVNCLKAAGVNNYFELRTWEKENPDKIFVREGNEVHIVQID